MTPSSHVPLSGGEATVVLDGVQTRLDIGMILQTGTGNWRDGFKR